MIQRGKYRGAYLGELADSVLIQPHDFVCVSLELSGKFELDSASADQQARVLHQSFDCDE